LRRRLFTPSRPEQVPSSLHLGNAVGGGAVPVSPAAEERALFGVARNDSLASRSSSATRLSKTVACDVEAPARQARGLALLWTALVHSREL